MARSIKPKALEMILHDSGTTSHMSYSQMNVLNRSEFLVSISLADDSRVVAQEKGTRSVQWSTNTGPIKVDLSESLVAHNLSQSLLSVPALVLKVIRVLFVPVKALLVDIEHGFRTIGTSV